MATCSARRDGSGQMRCQPCGTVWDVDDVADCPVMQAIRHSFDLEDEKRKASPIAAPIKST